MDAVLCAFELAEVRRALERIETSPTLHEGLYSAVVEEIQWLESLRDTAPQNMRHIRALVDFVTECGVPDVSHRTHRAISRLSEQDARQLVDELYCLCDMLKNIRAGCRLRHAAAPAAAH